MRVSLAVQVLSRSVASALYTYVYNGQMSHETEQTAKFVQMIDDLWNLMNYRVFDTQRINEIDRFDEFSLWIQNWEFVTEPGQKKGNIHFKKCLLVTLASFTQLFREILNKYTHLRLYSRRFNQDCLENTFSQLRHDRGGFNSNPDVWKTLQSLRIVSSANVVRNITSKNCEDSDESLLVDPSALKGFHLP